MADSRVLCALLGLSLSLSSTRASFENSQLSSCLPSNPQSLCVSPSSPFRSKTPFQSAVPVCFWLQGLRCRNSAVFGRLRCRNSAVVAFSSDCGVGTLPYRGSSLCAGFNWKQSENYLRPCAIFCTHNLGLSRHAYDTAADLHLTWNSGEWKTTDRYRTREVIVNVVFSLHALCGLRCHNCGVSPCPVLSSSVRRVRIVTDLSSTGPL